VKQSWQRRIIRSSPLTIRNVQLKFTCCLVLCLNITASGEPADQESYREIMQRGLTRLQMSYHKSKLAQDKKDEASKLCKANDRDSEIEFKHLQAERKQFADNARASAEEALKEFRSAETLQPANPEPIFVEGLALLQLEEYCSAIEKIQLAREWHYRNPTEPAETTFALGAALVASSNIGSASFEQGKKLLADYIKQAEATPNRDEAFPNFNKANDIYKAAVGQPAKQTEQNQQKNDEPNRGECPMPIPGKTELPVVVSCSSAIGYNDNVLRLGRGQALPAGTAGKDSVYNESSFTLGRDFSLSHPSGSSKTGWLADQLSVSYVFIADTFAELPERDTLLNTVLGSYQRAFTPHLGGLLKISDQWLYTDQTLGSNLFTAQEALVVNLNARLKTLLSYYLIRTDGFIDSIPPNDPDGFTHRVEVAQSWVIVQDAIDFSPKFTLSVQYGHEWDEPNGITGQFQRNDLQGKIEYKAFRAQDQCSFIRAVTASLSETWRSDDYVRTALTSLACPGGCARSDDTNQLIFALRISMWYDQYLKNAGVPEASRMEAYFQYWYTTRDSNVQFKGYDQNLFLASLKLNF